MTIEENGFHFRRVGADGLRLAMGSRQPRWDGPEEVATGWSRTGASASRTATRAQPVRRCAARGPASTT